MQFTVLASGSSGNASFVEARGFGILIDAGLGPRQLAQRMALVDLSWQRVHAVLLTHTHSDHWKDRTLAQLRRRRIRLHCHDEHGEILLSYGREFARLLADGLVGRFSAGAEWEPAAGLRCKALPLAHDGGATFGFRIEADDEDGGRPLAIGYLADLGSWDAALVDALCDVDLLALEFNHDVDLECTSGRSPQLIARVLGNHGHLSNDQAAAYLRELICRSGARRLQHIVQLHLSRDCNRPELAARAAETVVQEIAVTVLVHTTCQEAPGPALVVSRGPEMTSPLVAVSRSRRSEPAASQAWLPGFAM